MRETSLSTQQPQAGQAARLSTPDVDQRRPGHPGGAPPQGPAQAVRLTAVRCGLRARGVHDDRVPGGDLVTGGVLASPDRSGFDALRRDGRRVRRGTVTVTWVPGDTAEPGLPRVAYAVGRWAGGAVVRNRIRRRLRAIIRDLGDELAPGTYLVGAGTPAATLPYRELRDTVMDALRAAPLAGRRL